MFIVKTFETIYKEHMLVKNYLAASLLHTFDLTPKMCWINNVMMCWINDVMLSNRQALQLAVVVYCGLVLREMQKESLSQCNMLLKSSNAYYWTE